MKGLRISEDLVLPTDVVTGTGVIYGGKGMGKTNLGSVYVEELSKAGLRWCVLDPMGVWWGLRHSADGKGPGIECAILGGAHGDIPIEPEGGEIIADLVVDEDVNTIVDFSRRANGAMWSIGDKVKFVTAYALRLFQRQGELVGGRRREPLLQILDEAARYIPQIIPSGAIDLAKCVGAWEQIVEEGRNVGLGVTFLTQRSARMNKSVSELADVMYAFRIVGPNSLKAITDWLGEHVEKARIADLAAKVRQLKVGEALVVSPGWLGIEKIVHIRHRETFDSSATPKPGQAARRVTGRAARPDLSKYQTRMAETIERAKAIDPKELRKKIAELERQLKAKAASAPEIQRVEVPVVSAETMGRVEGWLDQLRSFVRLPELLKNAGDEIQLLRTALSEIVARAENGRAGTSLPARNPYVPAGPARQSTVRNAGAAGRSSGAQPGKPPTPGHDVEGVTEYMRKLLEAFARRHPLPISLTQLSLLSGYSRRSSSFDGSLAKLRGMGLIETAGPGGSLRLTDEGQALAGAVDPDSTEDRIAMWRRSLSQAEAKIFDAIVAAYPRTLTREAISEETGYSMTSSSFDGSLSALRKAGLIQIPVSGELRAHEDLFS